MSSPAEQARLEELRRLDVLDSETEQAFDDLTALAASICGTPISVISLVDADRVWFKSRVGLELEETPRSRSFCGQAILEDRILVVGDAAGDRRFAAGLLVAGEPAVRFYAGKPLRHLGGPRGRHPRGHGPHAARPHPGPARRARRARPPDGRAPRAPARAGAPAQGDRPRRAPAGERDGRQRGRRPARGAGPLHRARLRANRLAGRPGLCAGARRGGGAARVHRRLARARRGGLPGLPGGGRASSSPPARARSRGCSRAG